MSKSNLFQALLLSGVAALALSGPALAKVHAGSAPQFSAQRLSEVDRIISADDYEGRGVATRAETKMVEFISGSFLKLGLKPGGPNGSWTQEVHLREFQVSNPKMTFNLPGGVALEAHPGQEMTISTRGALKDVAFDKAPLVFVGYGVTAPERGWDDFKGLDVKGKIIVVLINDPDFAEPELKTFGGKAMTYYGRWTYKYEEAARRGALGCLIIHDTDAASYGWETVKNSNNGHKFDIVRADPSKASPALESWISHDTADKLFAASGLDLNALRTQARHKDFQPVELKGVSLSGSYGVSAHEIISHNVIGLIPGTKHADETFLYSAHWDHLGIGTPDAKGDKIFNGALDNGTGISALIELARAFSKAPRADRSVAFIAFTAEEQGLLGSEYYATNPVFPLGKTVGGINMDSLNIYGRTHNVEVVGAGQSSMEDDLVRLAAKQHRIVTADETPEAGHFFRSDHFPLVKRGVPMLAAGSGLDLIKGGVAAGRATATDYVSKHYHQPSDEWSANWDLSGMIEDLQIFYTEGRELTTSRTWPQWKAGSEFKGARDASNADRP